MAISGLYNVRGYAVLSNGEPIYSAGNSEHDSQVYLSEDAPGSLDLATIQRYCLVTMAEMAQERAESLGQAIECDNADDYFVGG